MRAVSIAWLAIAAVAVGLTTCTEAASGPHGGLTRIAVHPHAMRASATAAPINRIVITAREEASSDVVGSTDLVVDPDASGWDLTLDVLLTGSEPRDVVLAIELFHTDATSESVEWSGIVLLTVTPGASSEVADVTLYPGPLAPVATVQIAPSHADVAVGGTLVLAAVVQDSAGNALSRTVAWTSSDTSVVTVSTSGVVNALAAGTATITATIEGKHATATISAYVPVATSIEKLGGDAQTATVSTTLPEPFAVQVNDQQGNPFNGQIVKWVVITGGGSVAPDSTVTDSGGVASATLTLGKTAGTQTVEARASGITGSPIVFTATATPPSTAASVTVTPATLAMTAGDTATFAAVARDSAKNILNNVHFTWRSSDTLVARVSTSGRVTARLAGTATITADAGSAAGTASVTVTHGPATTLSVFAGNAQTAQAGTALPDSIMVFAGDLAGNAVSGVAVTWSVVSGGGTVSVRSTVTNKRGVAATTWTLGSTLGQQVAQATSSGLANSPVQFTATAENGAMRRTWLGGAASNPTGWSVAANWSPAGVPSAVDSVIIPSTANQPHAGGDVVAGTLVVRSGAILNNDGYQITVSGDADVAGSVVGSGGLVLTGSGGSVRGAVSSLLIEGTYTANGAIETTADLQVSHGDLVVNGQSITVGGNFKAGADSGTITMTNSADLLTVTGQVQFANTDERGKLTNGEIVVAGDFVNGCYNGNEFVSTGTTVTFAGNGTDQNIAICSSAGNRFYVVTIAAGASVVTNDPLLVIDHALTVSGTLTVQSGNVVDVAGAAGSLVLNSGGVINNNGTIRANLPITNNGGTINGNAIVQR